MEVLTAPVVRSGKIAFLAQMIDVDPGLGGEIADQMVWRFDPFAKQSLIIVYRNVRHEDLA